MPLIIDLSKNANDRVLVAYVFLLIPLMLIGFGFARRKLFVPHHKLVMTIITIANWFLIGAVMLNTFSRFVAPRIPTPEASQPIIFLPAIHTVTGILAQIVATYLVIRMWLENQLPDWFKVKNIKRYMRFTLAMWLITALLGIATWFAFHQAFRVQARPATTPAATTPTVGATTAPAVGTAPATPGATQDATTAVPATPGATQDATTAAPAATPGSTQEATTAAPAPATPASTESR
jgi:uncharacterized membrane protein YozB (DUF420 family)